MAFGAELVGGLRERVLTAVDGGLPSKTVAARSGVSLLFFDKVLKRRRVSGETTARAQRNQQESSLRFIMRRPKPRSWRGRTPRW